jgi:hypothetical protein
VISRLQIAVRELQKDPAKGEQVILDPDTDTIDEDEIFLERKIETDEE